MVATIICILITVGFMALIISPFFEISKNKNAVDPRNEAINEARNNRLGIVVFQMYKGHVGIVYAKDGTPFEGFVYDKPNSADGWSYKIEFINSCRKTIKYVHFHVTARNRVKDVASTRVGEAVAKLSLTGPVNDGEIAYPFWENVVYSTDVDYIEINSIDVDYMDGTKETFDANHIVYRWCHG